MQTFMHICIALLAPLPALKKVPAHAHPSLWWAGGTLAAAWFLEVVAPVAIICLLAIGYASLSVNSSAAATKNPHP